MRYFATTKNNIFNSDHAKFEINLLMKIFVWTGGVGGRRPLTKKANW